MNYIPFIRVVPDFPKEGISFKDISPLLKDSEAFNSSVDDMAKLVKKFNPTVIVGQLEALFLEQQLLIL